MLGDSKNLGFFDAIFDQLFVEAFGNQLEHLFVWMSGDFWGSIDARVGIHSGQLSVGAYYPGLLEIGNTRLRLRPMDW